MEYAQRAVNARHAKLKQCLNPYFNGTCSKSDEDNVLPSCFDSLNPYFNGTCSKRYGKERDEDRHRVVLILILMEHAQRVIETTVKKKE